MSRFRVLVVDDDAYVRDSAEKAMNPELGVLVVVASSLEEALSKVEEDFFHLAIVDLELSKAHRELAEGRTVLRGLLAGRPSCRRVLLTKYSTEMPEKVFELWSPTAPVVEAAIDKAGFGSYFDGYLKIAAEQWSRAPVEFENLEEAYEALSSKGIKGQEIVSGRTAEVTLDEFEYLLQCLFGQRARDEGADPDDIAKVALSTMSGGKSRSVVLQAVPTSHLGHEGLRCVVKVGPREEAEQELARYERYVRMRMPLARRIELLGHAMADGLGAISYSFAGDDPGRVRDLQQLLDTESPDVEGVLKDVFASGTGWSEDSPEGDDLASFFSKAYGLRPRAVLQDIKDFSESMAVDHGWAQRKNKLILGNGKIHLPGVDDVGRGLLHRSFRAAVVHGDLNASNVILSGDGRSIIIDYRHTTRGPRTLDLAAMHASVRISRPACSSPIEDLADDELLEYRLWNHDFGSDTPWWSDPGDPPYWLSSAAMLMRIKDRHMSKVSQTEYAATCWLYALRVFRVRSIGPEAKLRLLVWISALSRVLADMDRES